MSESDMDPLTAAERKALAKLRQWWRHRTYENRRHLVKATTEWIRADHEAKGKVWRKHRRKPQSESLATLRKIVDEAEAAAKLEPGYRADIDG